jgi:hypothetical protein
VAVRGWAVDPDTASSIAVHVYVNDAFGGWAFATLARPDVGAAYPSFGSNHGYSFVVGPHEGSNTICAYGITAVEGTTNSVLGCRRLRTTLNPIGNLDVVGRVGSQVRIRGWAIDLDTSAAIPVHVYVNGGWGGSHLAAVTRSDVGAAYPAWGAAHGFDVTLAAPAGSTVCVYGINTGPGSNNPVLACRTV